MGSVTLMVPRVRTSNYGERTFHCSAAKLWNTLPAHICESNTLNIFKILLKTLMSSSHFGVSFIYLNLALYIYCHIIFVISYIYVFHKFKYSTFEQALSMNRALYKFGIIITIIDMYGKKIQLNTTSMTH